MKVVIAQKGAREHFLAARALNQHGKLAGLVTDWYAFGRHSRNGGGRKRKFFQRLSTFAFRHVGGRGRSALAAWADGIPDEVVQAMPLRSLWWKWQVRMAARRGRLYDDYTKTDAAFAKTVARLNLPEHNVFFGYSYASLEMLARSFSK